MKQLHASVLIPHSVRVDCSQKVMVKKAVKVVFEVLLEVPLVIVAGQGQGQGQTVDITDVPVQAHREFIVEAVGGHLPTIAVVGEAVALTKAAVPARIGDEVGVQVENKIVIEIMDEGDADRFLDHVPKSVEGVESQQLQK